MSNENILMRKWKNLVKIEKFNKNLNHTVRCNQQRKSIEVEVICRKRSRRTAIPLSEW